MKTMLGSTILASLVYVQGLLGIAGAAVVVTEPARKEHHAPAPAATIHKTMTTQKTSRLPASDIDRACKGQGWGGESISCLNMIARESGKAGLSVRLIADAAPANLSTPNVF